MPAGDMRGGSGHDDIYNIDGAMCYRIYDTVYTGSAGREVRDAIQM